MPYTIITRRNNNTALTSDVQKSSISWDESRRPLPYYVAKSEKAGYWIGVDGYVSGGSPNRDVPFGNVHRNINPGSSAYAVAYDRLMKKVGEKASLALTLYDRKKSCEMIAVRCKQLLDLVSKIKKGQLRGKPTGRSGKKARRVKDGSQTLADTWLEYTFGWVPLFQDIYTAIDVMQSSPPAERVRGSARVSYPILFDQTKGNPLATGSRATGVAFGGVSLSCQVVVSNPDLYLANQLGLVNPAGVIWDAIPFSFVVDWFLPVNKFLMSMSQTWGLELKNCSQSYAGYAYANMYWRGSASNFQEGFGKAELFSRKIGTFVTPRLLDRAHLPAPSLWLAATSLSLLRQQLNQLPFMKRL